MSASTTTGALPWPLSASSDTEVRARAQSLVEHVRDRPDLGAGDLGYTLATERAVLEHRAVVVGEDRAELLAGLEALAEGRDHDGLVRGTARPYRGTVMVFTGAGGQWRGMGGGLWEESRVFREEVRACEEAFEPYLDWSLVDVVRGRRGAASLNRVDVLQPALFTVLVSLAALWRSFGVRPTAVVGHSQGEIAAAHVAGALSLSDSARMVALRSRVIAQKLVGRGAMLSVPLPAATVRERLLQWGDRLAVAGINGPTATSVAGDPEAIEQLFTELVDDDVRVARIASDFASHSAQVDDVRRPLIDAMDGVRPHPTDVLFCSTVTGGILDPSGLDADYWYQNLRRPVEFDSAVRTLLDLGLTTFVEPSPQPLLVTPVEDTARQSGSEVTVVGSLRMGESDTRRMLTSLASAQVSGLPVDWTAAYADRTRVDLPVCANQEARHGAEPGAVGAAAPGDSPDGPFWRAVERGDLAGGLGIVLPAMTWCRRPTPDGPVAGRRADDSPEPGPDSTWCAEHGPLPGRPSPETGDTDTSLITELDRVGASLAEAARDADPQTRDAVIARLRSLLALWADPPTGRPVRAGER